MPDISPEQIDWDDANLGHATRHGVSFDEINQVLMSDPEYRTNAQGRSGDYVATGKTAGGRTVSVVVAWAPRTRTVRPITAWEEK
jgi:uncharacterized DUF497 family protein